MAQPGSQELLQARKLSKNGQFKRAIGIYAELFRKGSLAPENHTSYGWDLFKATRLVFEQAAEEQFSPPLVAEAKQHLNAYMKLADYDAEPIVGDSVVLKLATFRSRKGPGIRVISAAPTNSEPGTHICKPFSATVRVSNGMGFTCDNIFIPPDLVSAHSINDEDATTGVAVLNYNKKRQVWGWKAITISGTVTERKI